MNKYDKCTTCLHDYCPKEISFKDLLILYDKILIPRIQRDYAQGRTDEKATDVRNNLLNDIFGKEDVKFDFIFGTRLERKEANNTEKCFIPLDGQQRLTTLFLLYLYGIRSGAESLVELSKLSKFSYDTRRAAKDFCKEITNADNKIDFNAASLSDSIKNSTWFLDYWQYDPTVESMLNMLDAIHEKTKTSEKYPNLGNIKFYFFDMDEHRLNENLYLKMNSRGKPLTAFENLKASIDKILPSNINKNPFHELEDQDNYLKEECNTFEKKWKHCIDKQWTDFFWKYKEDYLVDAPFLRFLSNCLAGFWIANEKELDENDLILDNLLKITGKENFILFEIFQKVFEKEGAFEYCARVLSIFSKYGENIVKKSKPIWEKQDYNIIEQILKPPTTISPTFKDRSILYAIIQYDDVDYAGEKFDNWMRFSWNIIENSVERKSEYISAVKFFAELSEQSTSILNYLKNETIISRFAQEQVKEEIAKAEKIIDEPAWKNKITDAEQTAFFKGAIRFLFYDENKKPDWNLFDRRLKKAKEYFDDKGVREIYRKDVILLRTLISKFTAWEQFWNNIVYDNNASSWKHILINEKWLQPVCQLFDIENIENYDFKICKYESNSEIEVMVYNDLCQTALLDNIAGGCKLNYRHYRHALYPYNTKSQDKIFVIGDKRNQIFSDLADNDIIEVDNGRIGELPYYKGWEIYFTSKKNNKKYQWWDTLKVKTETGDWEKIDDATLVENIETYLKRMEI